MNPALVKSCLIELNACITGVYACVYMCVKILTCTYVCTDSICFSDHENFDLVNNSLVTMNMYYRCLCVCMYVYIYIYIYTHVNSV
jgi:hypothetical protein